MQIIQRIDLTSTQSSINFNSIPQTFTDLCLLVSLRSTVAANTGYSTFRLNSTTSGYSGIEYVGLGDGGIYQGATNTDQGNIGQIVGSTATSNTFSNGMVMLPNYTQAINKVWHGEANGEGNFARVYVGMFTGFWANTAAVTSISILEGQGNSFLSGSSATLYGITKGSDGIVTVS